jgi:hypothetical protein
MMIFQLAAGIFCAALSTHHCHPHLIRQSPQQSGNNTLNPKIQIALRIAKSGVCDIETEANFLEDILPQSEFRVQYYFYLNLIIYFLMPFLFRIFF